MAKEQFREKIPKGQIRIQIQEKKSDPVEIWETTAEKLYAQIKQVVDGHQSSVFCSIVCRTRGRVLCGDFGSRKSVVWASAV